MKIQSSPVSLLDTINDDFYMKNAIELLLRHLPVAMPLEVKSTLDWLEEVFVTPTGPYKGSPFDRRVQPATSLLLEMLDDPYWRSAMLVAPNQAGKSQLLIHLLFTILFNKRETAIFGVPDIDKMWATKLHEDILPPMESSAILAKMLPDSGRGSKGGTPTRMRFNNGVSLIAMGAGAGDSQRAGATARCVLVTEVKDFGNAQKKSAEGSKLDQLIRRTLSHMGKEFVFGESTVTTTENVAWTWYLEGTQSMPHFPCEGCGEHIAPEREHLIGWQDARTEEEAREKSRFTCPNKHCGYVFTEAKRKQLLQEAVVLHHGQTVEHGKVIGPIPPTRHLSYRFTASTNMLADAGTIGVDEWKNVRRQDRKKKAEKEREISQRYFAVPSDMFAYSIDQLDSNVLMLRSVGEEFGVVPEGYNALWGGVDVRKSQVHWLVIASGENVGPRIIAWGEERIVQYTNWAEAVKQVAEEIQDKFRRGFAMAGTEDRMPVTLTLMDSGYKDQEIYACCDMDDFWLPLKAFGSGYLEEQKYKKPIQHGTIVRHIGDGFDVKYLDYRWVVHSNASDYKSKLHEALRTDIGSVNGMTIASTKTSLLRELIGHLTAEVEKVHQESGEGQTYWEPVHSNNHWLDAASYANLSRFVWQFIQEMIAGESADDGSYTVHGSGPLFG